MRDDLVQLTHFSCLLSIYHHDMSVKELKCCMAISLVVLFSPSSSKQTNRGTYHSTKDIVVCLK